MTIRDTQMRALEKGCGGTVVSCPKTVKVLIKLSQPVACPGHPLEIEAVGTPSGGTYEWAVSGAELVDRGGSPKSSGNTVYLRAFQADDGTGRIPEIQANVSVTYTHADGTASDAKPVPVHGIHFQVSSVSAQGSDLEAREQPAGVYFEQRHENTPTVNVEPTVTIRLAASCPRKAECARNHRVGWLQDVTEWEKSFRFRQRMVRVRPKVGPPLRDADTDPNHADSVPFPFYSEPFTFQDDGDSYRVNHSDSPGFGALWEDQKAAKPEDSPLEEVKFRMAFSAWLVVQNVEWSGHDLEGSFAYQRNFDWSFDCGVKVTGQRGRKTEPQFFMPKTTPVAGGKGASSPSFTEISANESGVTESTPIAAPRRERPVTTPASRP